MSFKYHWRRFKYRYLGRRAALGESSRARPRRVREGFFERYCSLGKGLDIGYGGDLLAPNCVGFDYEHGDAQYLPGIPNESYDFVYSSHTLEHMISPRIALKNWWRAVKAGGFLILYVPDRDLYEKRRVLPSRWNSDHKHFFLIDRDEAPDTIGLLPLIKRCLTDFEVIYAKRCADGHTINDPDVHSNGEYSIEIVLHKDAQNGS
jgi:SAM-dependent methyltransferase